MNGNVTVSRDPAVLEDATFVVEAIIEDPDAKADVWNQLAGHLADDAVLATTTSSLPVSVLAAASGHPERFVGLHVFNPVPKMDLIELAFPPEATDATRERRPQALHRARQDGRRGARTRRASSSTACSSRTCSTRCG